MYHSYNDNVQTLTKIVKAIELLSNGLQYLSNNVEKLSKLQIESNKLNNRIALHVERLDKRQNEIFTYLNSKMKDKQ